MPVLPEKQRESFPIPLPIGNEEEDEEEPNFGLEEYQTTRKSESEAHAVTGKKKGSFVGKERRRRREGGGELKRKERKS